MAQKVVQHLVDDLDGTELADGKGETVSFALDGTSYELDLSTGNADRLREILQEYIAAGRRLGRVTGRTGTRTRTGPSAQEVRHWARTSGLEVPDRGRIPQSVRDAFDARA